MSVSAPGRPRPVTPASILAAQLADLLGRAESAAASSEPVDPGWLADLRSAAELAEGLDPYLDAMTTPESPALAELARRTAAEDWNGPQGNGVVEQEMLSGHVEGQLLKALVRLARAERVLEVGMFTGYSALAMAEALPEGGRVVALELDPGVAAFAQRCLDEAPDGDKVEVRVGPALETLEDLAADGEVFDLVFIDADKAGYEAYLARVLDGLLAPHGAVVVDNTLMQGLPWGTGPSTANGEAVARFNAAVAADPGLEQVVVPLRDGLTLIRRAETSLK